MAKLPGPKLLVRPLLRRIKGYVPGEQPKISGLVKLNTNENPYPPSPKVLMAIRAAVDGRLRLYPNPTCDSLRGKLARFHHCRPENIIVGNGSDELLAMAVRAFVEPAPGPSTTARGRRRKETRQTAGNGSFVQYFSPSYSLYPVLADLHGALKNPVQLDGEFNFPTLRELKTGRIWNFKAALTFITTPNAPTGRSCPATTLEEICESQRGVVVLDEAYVDFARDNALELGLRYPNVLVARTFSKAYSLCFQRVGYFVGHPDLIRALQTIRDSYNVNGLGQIAAEATLADLAHYRRNIKHVIAAREQLSTSLSELGFTVFPSESNFLFVRPPLFPARDWLEKLRGRKILVRWFSAPEVRQYLRISIGTPPQMDLLLEAVRAILNSAPSRAKPVSD